MVTLIEYKGLNIYKNVPIIYSLGNFLFRQNTYRFGNLRYPSFCDRELAFEYCDSGNHNCHFFYYDKNKQSLKHEKSEKLNDSKIMKNLSDFNKIKISKYDKWFKKNRYHKN